MSIPRVRERDERCRFKRAGQSECYCRDGVALDLIASSMNATVANAKRQRGERNRKKMQARRTSHTGDPIVTKYIVSRSARRLGCIRERHV